MRGVGYRAKGVGGRRPILGSSHIEVRKNGVGLKIPLDIQWEWAYSPHMNADIIQKGQTTRRGDFLVTAIHDRTRVTHPKTADIIEIAPNDFLVVPTMTSNPVMRKPTFGEAMEYIHRYVGADE